ncbi:MAG: hypothetical protein JXN65_03480 [Clostridia bacterium]|nr:hypothetical protein [Clostridia bacterium]
MEGKQTKSTYRVKEEKNTYKMTYTGNLKEALEKAKEDLEKKQNDPNMPHWEWIKNKAEKEIEANKRAIGRIKAFISAAEEKLKEGEQ